MFALTRTRSVIQSLTTKDMRRRVYRVINDTRTIARRTARNLPVLRNGERSPEYNSFPVRLTKLQYNGYPTFFGYYDKSPFSMDETKVLAMVLTVQKDWQQSALNHPLKLGYFDVTGDGHTAAGYREFGASSTWCWQQGCMLQWFPADADRFVLFNCIVDEKYGSVIWDIDKKKAVQRINSPVYSIDNAGKFGVSINFSRLERLRPGYGYRNLVDESETDACPENDGIRLVDFRSGKVELLFSLHQIAQVSPSASMRKATHYVNHLTFNPGGSRLVFHHIWLPDAQNPDRRFVRLLCADLSTGKLFVLEDSATTSHYSWINEREILSTRVKPGGRWQYVRYILRNDTGVRCMPYENLVLDNDGHPSMSPSGSMILTDTEDVYGEKHPLLITLNDNAVYDLGGLYHPRRYYDIVRCDLHPRWDRTGRRICFDSVHDGRRALYIADVEV